MRQQTNAEWLEEIEGAIEALGTERERFDGSVDDDDIEAWELFAATERRWRRLERKLSEAGEAPERPVNEARCRNVDAIIEALEEAYYQLDKLLD